MTVKYLNTINPLLINIVFRWLKGCQMKLRFFEVVTKWCNELEK